MQLTKLEYVREHEEKGDVNTIKYTQVDLDGFEIVNGYKLCPTGDYSLVSKFESRCRFDCKCIFGPRCCFGHDSIFNCWCEFDIFCKFDASCRFDFSCKFMKGCIFGDYGSCSEYCRFAPDCVFGNHFKFGLSCSFGECCKFGDACDYENGAVIDGRFMRFGNINNENRDAYFYMDKNQNCFLRIGIFFGDLNAFKGHCYCGGEIGKLKEQYILLFDTCKKIFELDYYQLKDKKRKVSS